MFKLPFLTLVLEYKYKSIVPSTPIVIILDIPATTPWIYTLFEGSAYITISNGAPNGTKSHELYHTTGVLDNGYDKGGILNSPPEKISSDEVDMMWNLIPLKKWKR